VSALSTFADAEAAKAERCWSEIGGMISSASWWSDAIPHAPSEVWGRIDELMADGDTCEAGNVLMEWGKSHAKSQVEAKYRVRLL
jgi:hypothetical protein